MTRQIKIAAFAAALLFAATSAHADFPYHGGFGVYGYGHGVGTVESSARFGHAAQMESFGRMHRLLAEADEIQARADAAYSDLAYANTQRLWEAKQMKIEYQKAKRDDKLSRQATSAANEETAALRLWKNAQQGFVAWPTALSRPEYSASMSLVESILRNWSPSDDSTSAAYRQALATEAGVLRNKIAANKTIAFNNRVEAVKTLKKLEILATMTDLSEIGPQLAMR
jgi:hypothetical protein